MSTKLFSVSVDWPALHTSFTWDHITGGLLCPLVSLSRMFWRFIYVIASIGTSFLLVLNNISFHGYTSGWFCFLVHSQVDGFLGCFHFRTIMYDAAMNIPVQVVVWTYILICHGYVPRSKVAGLCGNSV